MVPLLPPNPVFRPGRYAAIDAGSHSTLLLVADVDAAGRLTPLMEAEEPTRLSERLYTTGRLLRAARQRTINAIAEFIDAAREEEALSISVFGTSVVREASNAPDFLQEIQLGCGLPLITLTGQREAELVYLGNLFDRSLQVTEGERVLLDIGGGSTEVVRGLGGDLRMAESFPIGAVRVTEEHLEGDPPDHTQIRAVERAFDEVLSTIEPLRPAGVVLGSGGTLLNLGRVALLGGIAVGDEVHGLSLTSRNVDELAELFRSLPLKFRRRVPGLNPERADVIFAGILILKRLLAELQASNVVVTNNGVRHGCVYAAALGLPLQPEVPA
jgi:exopolyphosphatase/guanosine-5'-triphosphate,3'-diphosphate pyrophosphatase